MKEKENFENNFDKIYHNKADRQELESFKEELANDEDLKRDFEDYILLHTAAQDVAREEFKAKFGKPKIGNGRSNLRRVFTRSSAIAASFILLVSSFLAFNHFDYWNKINKRHQPISEASTFLGKVNPEKTPLDEEERLLLSNESFLKNASELMNEENYAGAITQFQKVEIISKEEYHDFFVAGYNIAVCQIRLKEKEKATHSLETLIARPESHFIKADAKELLGDLRTKPLFLF